MGNRRAKGCVRRGGGEPQQIWLLLSVSHKAFLARQAHGLVWYKPISSLSPAVPPCFFRTAPPPPYPSLLPAAPGRRPQAPSVGPRRRLPPARPALLPCGRHPGAGPGGVSAALHGAGASAEQQQAAPGECGAAEGAHKPRCVGRRGGGGGSDGRSNPTRPVWGEVQWRGVIALQAAA